MTLLETLDYFLRQTAGDHGDDSFLLLVKEVEAKYETL